ncbi:MAG: hypothetical protein K9I94_06135 [Bacteroidales bacterium]|nr:hypothetical protein [Bacteroidales bacterium]
MLKQTFSTSVAALLLLAVLSIYSCEKDDGNNVNTAPTCTITNPGTGTEIIQGTIVTISADVKDDEENISKVIFFVNDEVMDTVNSSPYIYEWNTADDTLGYHTIKVMAVDNESEMGEDETEVNIVDADGKACPRSPIVDYEGQTYRTVMIGDQCWMAENLNLGQMIDGPIEMKDNDTIEKYCYDNDQANCEEYGGYYQWDELMQYTENEGAQGLCPEGWHIPTDKDWMILVGYVGENAGYRLRSSYGWNGNENGTDEFNFTVLPGAYRPEGGNFEDLSISLLGYVASFWTSSEAENEAYAWRWSFDYESDELYRVDLKKNRGYSVRCIKNME